MSALADQADSISNAVSATTAAVTSATSLQASLSALLGGPAVPWLLLTMAVCALAFVVCRYVMKVGRGDAVVR